MGGTDDPNSIHLTDKMAKNKKWLRSIVFRNISRKNTFYTSIDIADDFIVVHVDIKQRGTSKKTRKKVQENVLNR